MKAVFTKSGLNTVTLTLGNESVELTKARGGYRAYIGGRVVIGTKKQVAEIFRLVTVDGMEAGKAIVKLLWDSPKGTTK